MANLDKAYLCLVWLCPSDSVIDDSAPAQRKPLNCSPEPQHPVCSHWALARAEFPVVLEESSETRALNFVIPSSMQTACQELESDQLLPRAQKSTACAGVGGSGVTAVTALDSFLYFYPGSQLPFLSNLCRYQEAIYFGQHGAWVT